MTLQERDRIADAAEARLRGLVEEALLAQGEAAARALETGADVEAAVARAGAVYLAALRAELPPAFAEAAALAYESLRPADG